MSLNDDQVGEVSNTPTAIAEDVQEDVQDVKRSQRSYAWWFPRKRNNTVVFPRQKRSEDVIWFPRERNDTQKRSEDLIWFPRKRNDTEDDDDIVKRSQRSYAWYAWFPRKRNNNTSAPLRQKRSPPPLPHLSEPCKCYFYFEGTCVCRNPFIRSSYCASCLYFLTSDDGQQECICDTEDLEKKPRLPRSIMLDSQLFTESLMFQFCSATLHGAYRINCEGSKADFFRKGYTVNRSNATANTRVALSALYTFLSREVYRMAQLLPSLHSNDALDHLYQLEKIFCRDYYDFTRNLTSSTLIDLCPVLVSLVGDLTEVRINADPQAQNFDFGRGDLDPQRIDFICSRRPNLCKNLVQWLHATELLNVDAETYTFKPETPNYYPILSGCFVHPEKCQQLYTMLRSRTIGFDSFHPLSFELLLNPPFDESQDPSHDPWSSSTVTDDSTNEIAQGSSEHHFGQLDNSAEQFIFHNSVEQFIFPDVSDYPITGPPPSDNQPQPDLVTVSNVCNCECSCGAQTWHSSCNYNHPIVNDTLICVCMCNCAEPSPSSCVCEAPHHRSTRSVQVNVQPMQPNSPQVVVEPIPQVEVEPMQPNSPQVEVSHHRSTRSVQVNVQPMQPNSPQVVVEPIPQVEVEPMRPNSPRVEVKPNRPHHRSTRSQPNSPPQVDYWPEDNFNVQPKSNVDGYTSRELEHNAEQHVVDIV